MFQPLGICGGEVAVTTERNDRKRALVKGIGGAGGDDKPFSLTRVKVTRYWIGAGVE